MCVAILKPYNKDVTEEDMRACFTTNPHGAGFMYPDKASGKVVVEKGFFTFQKFWEAYQEHANGPAKNTAIAIHFRIATSGKKDHLNCHPHIIAEDSAFVHNGVMNDYAYTGKEYEHKSDTAHFMEDVLVPLYEKFGNAFLQHADLSNMIQKYIGLYNKMIFMNPTSYWILNETQGDWIRGVWYSNKHWQPLPAYTPQSEHVMLGSWRDPGLTKHERRELRRDLQLRSRNVHGCWLGGYEWTDKKGEKKKGKWVTWMEYAAIYPKFDGPYEDYLRGKPPAKVMELDKKKEPAIPESSDSNNGLLGDVITDADCGAGCETMEEGRCRVCMMFADRQELKTNEGWCSGCLSEYQDVGRGG